MSGMQTTPLVSKTVRPDGSTVYDYNVEGDLTVYTVPPQGFDFADASTSQLTEYGVPLPPSDPSQRSDWNAMVANLHFVTPPPALVISPMSSTDYPPIRSGYMAINGSYANAEVDYNQPQALGTSCSGNAETTWAGIGGYNVKDLAQDGTSLNVGGFGQYEAWSEVLPDQPGMVAQDVWGTPGYGFYAEVWRETGAYLFYMYNTYNGSGTEFITYSNSYNGSTAEAVAERPSSGGHPVPLTDYSYINFRGSWINGSGIGNYPNTNLIMWSSHDMADVGGLSSGGAFTNYWHYCS